jgi:uncharacterized protein (TIGR02271 family)
MADIEVGAVVYSADGEKLGKLVRMDGDLLVVEKGFFFPEDYAFRRSDVASASNGEIRLSIGREVLRGEQRGPAAEARPQRGAEVGSESVSVPVAEEQLEVQKRARTAGNVRVTKQVREEQKQVTVPVRKEEVRVERVPATSASSRDARIEGGRVDVPVVEEEVANERGQDTQLVSGTVCPKQTVPESR